MVLLAVLAIAPGEARADSVSQPTVQLSTTAAGVAHVTWLVDFTTSPTGAIASGGSITVTGPSGTAFATTYLGHVRDLTAGTDVGYSYTTSPTGQSVTVTAPAAIPAGHRIELELQNVTNPQTGGPVSISTSADQSVAQTSAFTTTPPGRLSSLSLSPTTTAASATQVTDLIDFTTSATGALAANNGTITITLPPSSVIPTDFVLINDLTLNRQLIGVLDSAGGSATATYTVDGAVPAGDQIELALSGVTNPPLGSGSVSVSTSSDPQAVTTSIQTTPAGSVSQPAVALTSSAAGAQDVTYTVDFTTSANGTLAGYDSALATSNGGTVTLALPSGSAIPASAAVEITDLSTGEQSIGIDLAISGAGGDTATFNVARSIPAGDRVSVAISGITNAPTGGTASVSTSSDPNPATVAISLAPQQALSAASVSLTSGAAAGTGVTYVVDATVSSSGGLAAGNGTITLQAPSGTVIPAQGISITDLTTGAQDLFATFNGSSAGPSATWTVDQPVHAGDRIELYVTGVTNPSTPLAQNRITLSTSSDTAATSNLYDIVAAGTVASPQLTLSNSTAGITGVNYAIDFATSATGALAAGSGTITVTLPTGSVIPSSGTEIQITDLTTEDTFSGVLQSGGGGASATWTVDHAIPAGDGIRIAIPGVTNPASASGLTASVSTSSDGAAATQPFDIGAGSEPSIRPAVWLSSSAAAAGGVEYRVDFAPTQTVSSAGGTITVTSSNGTLLPADVDLYDVSIGVDLGIASASSGVAAATQTYGSLPADLQAGNEIELTIGQVTNPSAAGAGATFAVTTSSDPSPQTTNQYAIVAQQAVSSPSVALTSTAPLATGVAYTVEFTTSSSGGVLGSAGTITLQAPASTAFDRSAPVDIYDVTGDQDLGGVSVQSGSGSTIAWTPSDTLPAGHLIRLTVADVTNPPSGGTLTVSTSSDIGASASVGLGTSGTIATPTVLATTPAAGASLVQYTVELATSATTGALAANYGTITLNGSGITFADRSIDVYDVTEAYDLGPAASSSATPGTWTLGQPVPAGDELRLTIPDVTNPSATGSVPISVSSSSDAAGSTSSPSFVSATQPAATSLAVSTTVKGTGPATYTFGFRTSGTASNPTGGLASDGTITLSAPSGTVLPDRDLQIVDLTDGSVSGSTGTPGTTGPSLTWQLSDPIAAGHRIRLVLTGVANPATGAPISISTSSDTVTAPTPGFSTAAPQAVANPTLLLSSTAAGATGVTLTAEFTTSADGALSAQDSTITLSAPSGTVLPNAPIDLFDVTDDEDLGQSLDPGSSGSTLTWTVPGPVPAGHRVRVTLAGVTNPAGGPGPLSIATSSDPATSQATLPPAPPRPVVSGVSPASGPAAGATPVTISGSGFSGATAVNFGGVAAGSFTVDSDAQISAVSPAGPAAGGTVDVTVTGPGGTSATGSADQFTYAASTSPPPPPNPSAPSVQAPTSTASSTGATVTATINPNGTATSASLEYGIDETLRQTPGPLYVSSTPSQSVGSDSATHAITFQPTGLVPNATYHFAVVATSSAGTTTTPDQTFKTAPSPTPPPPPVLGKTADAVPVQGTVFILPPPGASISAAGRHANLTKGEGFLPLTEARSIPSGSLIDSRAGTLRLVTATGAAHKTQSGTFAGGVYTFLQSSARVKKGLTTLTLKESAFAGGPSYASCKAGARTHAGTAAAGRHGARHRAGHKPVSHAVLQTLHARDDHGRFTTRGRYSAGTVRGTIWDTSDRCDGTLTTVRRGTVDVFDFSTRQTIAVHAHHSYLARANGNAPKHGARNGKSRRHR